MSNPTGFPSAGPQECCHAALKLLMTLNGTGDRTPMTRITDFAGLVRSLTSGCDLSLDQVNDTLNRMARDALEAAATIEQAHQDVQRLVVVGCETVLIDDEAVAQAERLIRATGVRG